MILTLLCLATGFCLVIWRLWHISQDIHTLYYKDTMLAEDEKELKLWESHKVKKS